MKSNADNDMIGSNVDVVFSLEFNHFNIEDISMLMKYDQKLDFEM